jgi:hypothetical protein
MGRHRDWPFGFIDLLLSFGNLLIGILVVVFVSMNPPAKNNPDAVKPPGSLAITVAWPEGNIDVDTWLKSPDDDKPVGYSRKDGASCALLRDDLGVLNDSAPFNLENAFCRSLPAGEWIINLHGYSVPQALVKVHVEIALNGRLLVSRDLDLRPKQERTVVRFKLDSSGQIVPGSENEVFAPLRSAQ